MNRISSIDVHIAGFILATVFFGLGDTATTVVILTSPELIEVNPVIRAVGIPGLLALKAGSIALAGAIVHAGRRSHALMFRVAPPTFCFTLASLGAFATVSNLFLFY